MKITIGEAGGKGVGFDLDTLLVTRLLIQANSGAGKSWLLRKLIERLYGHVQVIVIDPEGEFATLRKKYDFVLVGAGGETPADVRSAGLLAEKLLELKASAVCDLYEMKPSARHQWVKEFLESMVNAPKKLWHPCVVIVDEAQLFCPQDGDSVAEEAMVSLTTRGRKRGFCAVWATQRLAKVNKDATAMLLNRLVGGTFEDVDIKRALDLLSVAPEEKRAVSQELKTMEPGMFFAFGRAITKDRLLFKVGQVETPHPQAGSAKHAAEPPPPTEKIRGLLPQLADLPQAAEQKAHTIEELKRELRTTNAKLAAAERAKPVAPDNAALPATGVSPERVKAAVEKAVRGALKERDLHWTKAWRNYERELNAERKGIFAAINASLDKVSFTPPLPVSEVSADVTVQSVEKPHAKVASEYISSRPHNTKLVNEIAMRAVAANNGHQNLSSAHLRILEALARFEAIGRKQVPRKWVAALASVSNTSSGYQNNLGFLRSNGYIDYPSFGLVTLTEKGSSTAPEIDAPTTAEEMLEHCKQIVNSSQAKLLDVLAEEYPRPLDKTVLAERAGVSSTSSGYQNNLGSLRSAGMIEYPQSGQVKAADWILLQDEAQ